MHFFKRNPRLFTPKDFDYSPYFDIIKYPFLGLDDLGVYRRLPWSEEDILYNDDERAFVAATRGEAVSRVDDRTLFSFTKKHKKTADNFDDDAPSIPNTTVKGG